MYIYVNKIYYIFFLLYFVVCCFYYCYDVVGWDLYGNGYGNLYVLLIWLYSDVFIKYVMKDFKGSGLLNVDKEFLCILCVYEEYCICGLK